ncbi:MAG: hypothetical protein IJH32_08350 [Ruminococcus sp.]|nr:hypothetical protein [Ruminococcus sp.]
MSKMNPKTQKKAVKFFSGRNGIILIALLAVMILTVSLITMSYSWFSPEVKKGTGMAYQADLQIRSENCSIVGTYKDTGTNGAKNYSTAVGTSETVPANEIRYFKTVIDNADANATNVSLYATALPSGTYGLGVAYPSNSYHKYTSGGSDVYIIRNAQIEGAADGENGEISVEWFIKAGSSAVTVNFSTLNLYLMYN